jgi:hypothetical protein
MKLTGLLRSATAALVAAARRRPADEGLLGAVL